MRLMLTLHPLMLESIDRAKRYDESRASYIRECIRQRIENDQQPPTPQNDDRNFWKKEHAGLMESYRFLQAKFDRADRVHNEEMGALEKERDFYVKAWERRGKALALPCLACGYTGNEIKMKQGETP